jgi:hypothetical protein
MLWLMGLAFSACNGGKGDAASREDTAIEKDTIAVSAEGSAAQPADGTSSGTLNAQCTIMRALSLDGGNRRYYVLNICPEDVTASHQAINISPPGEPSVTTYFDTIRSFATEAAARAFAEQEGLVDLYFEPES